MKSNPIPFLISFLLATLICKASPIQRNSFIIKGKFIGTYNGFIYLRYPNKQGNKIWDSCLIKNGVFQFTGQVNCYAKDVYLRLDSKSTNYDLPNAVRISLENSIITMIVHYNDFKHIKVNGAFSDIALTKHLNTRKKIDQNISYYKNKLEESPDSLKMSFQKKIDSYENKSTEMDLKYCEANPNSNISPYLLFSNRYNLSNKDIKHSFFSLSKTQQSSYYGNKIQDEITERNKIESMTGAKAPLFTTTDINNNPISLDSINNGKIILLDFWASWCAPCRAGVPHLKQLYTKYKTNGFEIIGIADNIGSESKWKDAMAQDSSFAWVNILRTIDRKSFDSTIDDISKDYRIKLLPTKILINKNGIIIGRYGADEEKELDKKLKEIFSF